MFRKARSVSQSSLISDRTAEASRRSEASLGKSVATRVERAPLPRHPSHDGLTGSPEPGVIVTDDELYAVHAAFLQTLEELPPVWLGLGELHTAAEHAPLAVGVDPDRREQRTRPDRTVVADFLVASIEHEVGDLADRPVAPRVELLIEFGRGAAHLRRGDFESA